MAWAGVRYWPRAHYGNELARCHNLVLCFFYQGGGGARRRVLASLSDLKENS